MVAVPEYAEPFDHHPLAREALVALVAVGALGLWVNLVGTFVREYVPFEAIDAPGGPSAELALTGFGMSVFFIAGMVLFVGAYLRVRDIEVSPTIPDRQVLAYGAGATAAGLALVGFVSLVVVVTGSSFTDVTGTSYGPGAVLGITMLITGLGLFVGVPAYVLVSHVLLQRTIERAGRPTIAIGLTTFVVGAIGPTAVLDVSPLQGGIGLVLVAGAIALPVIAAERYEHRWLVVVTAIPAVLLVAGLLAERISDLAGVAGGAHLLAVLGVVAVGAYAYERTDSVVPSALAYATFVVALDVVHYGTAVGF